MTDRYKIYPDINFAVSKLEAGVKTFKEIYDLALKFRNDENFTDVHFQLTDMRGCSFDFDINRISEMSKLVELYKEDDNQLIGVYIVDQPLETAYVHMFFEQLKYVREYCSTVEKAYDLLKLSIPFKEFLKKIDI